MDLDFESATFDLFGGGQVGGTDGDGSDIEAIMNALVADIDGDEPEFLAVGATTNIGREEIKERMMMEKERGEQAGKTTSSPRIRINKRSVLQHRKLAQKTAGDTRAINRRITDGPVAMGATRQQAVDTSDDEIPDTLLMIGLDKKDNYSKELDDIVSGRPKRAKGHARNTPARPTRNRFQHVPMDGVGSRKRVNNRRGGRGRRRGTKRARRSKVTGTPDVTVEPVEDGIPAILGVARTEDISSPRASEISQGERGTTRNEEARNHLDDDADVDEYVPGCDYESDEGIILGDETDCDNEVGYNSEDNGVNLDDNANDNHVDADNSDDDNYKYEEDSIDDKGGVQRSIRSSLARECKQGELNYTAPLNKQDHECWELMLNEEPLMPRPEFLGAVMDITEELTGSVGRRNGGFSWSSRGALKTLQWYSEDFVSEVVNRAMLIAKRAKGKTKNGGDVQTYMMISGKQTEPYREFHSDIRDMCNGNKP